MAFTKRLAAARRDPSHVVIRRQGTFVFGVVMAVALVTMAGWALQAAPAPSTRSHVTTDRLFAVIGFLPASWITYVMLLRPRVQIAAGSIRIVNPLWTYSGPLTALVGVEDSKPVRLVFHDGERVGLFVTSPSFLDDWFGNRTGTRIREILRPLAAGHTPQGRLIKTFAPGARFVAGVVVIWCAAVLLVVH